MQPESLQASLAKHPFVAGMNDAQVAFLLGCTKNVRFAPGDYLFREGTAADTLFLMRTGRVALETHVPGRSAIKVETLQGDGVLGWSTLFPPYLWYVDARALEPTLVFSIDGRCLRSNLERDAAFGFEITRRLLHHVSRRLERARLQQLDVYKAEQ